MTPVRALLVVMLLAAPASAGLIRYTGELAGLEGLSGTGIWTSPAGLKASERDEWTTPRIAWSVERNVDGTWHYDYTVGVYRGEPSHLIIETTTAFGEGDLLNLQGAGQAEIGWHFGLFGANPTLPAPTYGVKFEGISGTALSIAFDSPRAPRWGDVYVKGGRTGGDLNSLWNAGLRPLTDVDPIGAAANGSLDNHMLVPGSIDFSPVPEPAAAVVLALGGVLLVVRHARVNRAPARVRIRQD